MTLTKAQAKAHQIGCELLKKEELSFEECLQVFEKFHEGADVNNRSRAAHFTPLDLASDFAIDVGGSRILDLCAGIGVLTFAYRHFRAWEWHDETHTLVCVERCGEYVEAGKKLLPEAEWILGDILDHGLQEELRARNFSTVIANPPFGKSLMGDKRAPRYSGKLFEYAALDIAATLADSGTFILPQSSSPFRYSGVQCYDDRRGDPESTAMKEYRRFAQETGIELHAGCGVDTSIYRDKWKGVSPIVEIVTFECLQEDDAKPMMVSRESADQLMLI